MEELYVFGRGNAQSTHFYNICFAIKNQEKFFMADTGVGNGSLKLPDDMKVDLSCINIPTLYI